MSLVVGRGRSQGKVGLLPNDPERSIKFEVGESVFSAVLGRMLTREQTREDKRYHTLTAGVFVMTSLSLYQKVHRCLPYAVAYSLPLETQTLSPCDSMGHTLHCS